MQSDLRPVPGLIVTSLAEKGTFTTMTTAVPPKNLAACPRRHPDVWDPREVTTAPQVVRPDVRGADPLPPEPFAGSDNDAIALLRAIRLA
ncbi:hypothetical protein SLNWT_3450 [Streptomyces albus]|uniref:Uncharacterized protein n=2 Tax=Streptomyces TaxID=1883 RepID=A0A0B5EYY9_STRA4|nr:hypothetical protein SLNWT_3450 [Streptomyces albus]AOU78131.1 hypothetical protein SLNHY_3440 [Streptomyces albus]AYN33887.1 hypothetical protein DUI70_3385 [Streptomyces albus]